MLARNSLQRSQVLTWRRSLALAAAITMVMAGLLESPSPAVAMVRGLGVAASGHASVARSVNAGWGTRGAANAVGRKVDVLNDVACISLKFCIAVGSSATTWADYHHVLVEVNTGTGWKVQPSPTIPGSNDAELLSVECSFTTSCIAVGYWRNAAGASNDQHQALVESFNGTKWSLVPPSATHYGYSSQLSGISCSTPSRCTAVGYTYIGSKADYGNEVTDFATLIVTKTSSGWKVISSPNLSVWDNFLMGVSCPTTSFCTAVGFAAPFWYNQDGSVGSSYTATVSGFGGIPIALVELGGTWSLDRSATGPGFGYQDNLYGVSCTSPKFCLAVGGSPGPGAVFSEVYGKGTWTPLRAPIPSLGTGFSDKANLFGVTCGSTGTCVAVGEYQTTLGNSGSEPHNMLVETYDAGMLIPSMTLTTSPPDTWTSLQGVACVTAVGCVGAGTLTASTIYSFGPFNSEDLNAETAWSGLFVPPPGPDTLNVVENAAGGFSTPQTAGGGTVTSTPAGIHCPGTCTARFAAGVKHVTIHVTANSDSVIVPTLNGCPTPAGGFVVTQSCVVDVQGGAEVDIGFTAVVAELGIGGFNDPNNQQLVDVFVNGCVSSGIALSGDSGTPFGTTFKFTADGAPVANPSDLCAIQIAMSLGAHTVSMTLSEDGGQRTSQIDRSINVNSVASFSWTVDPVPYGTDNSKPIMTTVHLDACASAGVKQFKWKIGSGAAVSTNCKLTIQAMTTATYPTTLTVIGPKGGTVSTFANVYVPRVFATQGNCSTFSISQNACWRYGFDWFGNVFALSGNPVRAPDYAVLAVSAGPGLINVAITCDGNVYYGGGVSVAAGIDLPVTAVMAFGYVGDPTTVAPANFTIDNFVAGETDSALFSGIDSGLQYVQGANNVQGEEYVSGFTAPSLNISESYDWPAPGDTVPLNTPCNGGIASSPIWQALMNQSVQSGSGLPTSSVLSGQAPTVGQGATVYASAPTGTFGAGAAITSSVHSAGPVVLNTVAATSKGAIGGRLRLPVTLAPGLHSLLLSGLAPGGATERTIVVALPVVTRLAGHGYWVVGSSGAVTAYGAARSEVPVAKGAVSGRVASLVATPSGKGYWLATVGGHVYAYGDARLDAARQSSTPTSVVGIAATPSGHGYWLATSSGHVYAYGDAKTYTIVKGPSSAVVGMAATPDGAGYWLVTSGGQVYAYGDAHLAASHGHGTGQVVAMASTPSGHGYWLARSNGSVSGFGDALVQKAVSGGTLSGVPVGIWGTPDGMGYWLLTETGHVVAYGDARAFSRASGPAQTNGLVAIADL